MIAVCARPACGHSTPLPDEHWLVVRPMVWSAFVEETTYCCSRCLVVDLVEKHRPREGQ